MGPTAMESAYVVVQEVHSQNMFPAFKAAWNNLVADVAEDDAFEIADGLSGDMEASRCMAALKLRTHGARLLVAFMAKPQLPKNL